MIRACTRSLLCGAFALLLAPSIAAAEPAVALEGSSLTIFDTSAPSRFVTHAVAGLPGAGVARVYTTDIRPADGQLYAITVRNGSGGTDTSVGQLWKIDLASAVATPVGSPFSSTLSDFGLWGMDFDPVTDRVRLVENDQDNYRINPNDGTLVAQDTDLTIPNVSDVAYDRSIAGANATTAYGLDYQTDSLVRIGGVDGSPSVDSGVTSLIGPFGTNVSATAHLDISPSTGTAYVVDSPNLYTVNLATGALGAPVALPFGAQDGLALLGTSTIAAPATAAASETSADAAITVTRTGVTNRPATVDYATANGTATAGIDYTAASGTVTFAAGQTSRTILVPVANDRINDPGETFTLALSNPGNATLGSPTTTTVTIGQETARPIVLALPVLPRSLANISRSGVTARFSVSEASRTTGALMLGTKTLGVAPPITAPGPAIRSARATLTPRGRLLLGAALRAARIGRVPLALVLRTTDDAGNVRQTTVRVFVRR